MLGFELFSADQLRAHAVALAAGHSVDRRPGEDRLLPRLAENERVLIAAHDAVTDAARPLRMKRSADGGRR